jgi:hypothetical protein
LEEVIELTMNTTNTHHHHSTQPQRIWLTWGQCQAMFEQAGLTRRHWLTVAKQQPPVITKRLFAGSKRHRYLAADVENQIRPA